MKDARNVLLELGKVKFGPPAKRAKAEIQGLEDLARFHRMLIQLLSAYSWDDVLGTR